MTSFNVASPILPVRNVAVALDHYRSLGFVTSSWDDSYGYARRDDVWLHLAHPDGNLLHFGSWLPGHPR